MLINKTDFLYEGLNFRAQSWVAVFHVVCAFQYILDLEERFLALISPGSGHSKDDPSQILSGLILRSQS